MYQTIFLNKIKKWILHDKKTDCRFEKNVSPHKKTK